MSLVELPECETAAHARALASAVIARRKGVFCLYQEPPEPQPIMEEDDPVFLPIDLYLSMPVTWPALSSMKIIRSVGECFQLTTEQMLSKRRDSHAVDARHIAMYLMKKHKNFSYPEIGRRLNRDHTTALHGVRRVEAKLQAEGNMFREAVPEIERRLGV